MASRVQTLVVPVFRRYWLWGAWGDRAAEAVTKQAPRSWRAGETLEERFDLLGQQITRKLQSKLMDEWRKLESAREGSLRNWGYRLSQAVLSREDPRETFLKHVPRDGSNVLDIIYPEEFKERLVRRRLRLLAYQGHRRHRRRLLYWSLAMIPQIPLMVTPLPNLTVYYTVYRIYSHFTALQGSKALEKGFTALDSAQLTALRDRLLQLQAASGVEYPVDSWPAKLIRKERRYLDIFDRLRQMQQQRRLQMQRERHADGEGPAEGVLPVQALLDAREGWVGSSDGVPYPGEGQGAQQAQQAQQAQHPQVVPEAEGADAQTGLKLCLVPSSELSALVRPADRVRTPLSDEAALAVGKAFGAPHLLELVARARRRVVGAMFPTNTEEWQA